MPILLPIEEDVRQAHYKSIKEEYIIKVAKNGKIKDWNYDNFNRWIKASGRSTKEKRELYELEALNK
jgi:hypothetical protein